MAKIGLTKRWLFLVLGIWLIFHGIQEAGWVSFSHSNVISGILLIIAGVFLIIDW